MITSLRLKDFKNFDDETLRIGSFTVIVGANASGKSNIRDAFRFLHGIGRGYTLAEIIGGKYGTDWKPIRGSSRGIARFGAAGTQRGLGQFALEIDMSPALRVNGNFPSNATYRVQVRPEAFSGGGLSIVSESCSFGKEEVFSESIFDDREMQLSRTQSALHQVMRRPTDFKNYEKLRTIVDTFHRARFFDFIPDRMREPAAPGQTTLGDGGENLPIVLQEICADRKRKSVLIDWVRELTPMDVKDLEFSSDPSDKVHLILKEQRGARIQADNASDGTLRFLAMLAALLGTDTSGLYFFEEIENGLHPSRLHLLVDLIERQTAKGRIQVIATTHSPDLLSLVSDETFENTSVTCRLEDSNDAIIRPVADLPNSRKLRESQGLGRLLAGGWVEDALYFTEGSDESDKK